MGETMNATAELNEETVACLPAPRLQFRWLPCDDPAYTWTAIYELVLPLRDHDMRRPGGDGVGPCEMYLEMGRTRRGHGPECPNDTPYRDGVHAHWDGAALGGLPIYVIDPKGQVWVETMRDGRFPEMKAVHALIPQATTTKGSEIRTGAP